MLTGATSARSVSSMEPVCPKVDTARRPRPSHAGTGRDSGPARHAAPGHCLGVSTTRAFRRPVGGTPEVKR